MRVLISSLTSLIVIGSGIGEADLPLVEEDIDLSDLFSPTEAPVDWCSWFGDTHFRIHGLRIVVDEDEDRLGLFSIPLAIAQRNWNVSAVGDVALTPVAKKFVDRASAKTLQWIKFQNAPRDVFEEFLSRGFESLGAHVDGDMAHAIVKAFTDVVNADRTRIARRVDSGRFERQDLIDQVRTHTDQIRSCLEQRIYDFEQLVAQRRLRLDRLHRLTARSNELGRLIAERMGKDKKNGLNHELQRAIHADSVRSVHRIVFAEGQGILEHLRSDLREIARKHVEGRVDIVYPLYLRAFVCHEQHRNQEHQPIRLALEKNIQGYEGIIGECRGSITELQSYQP